MPPTKPNPAAGDLRRAGLFIGIILIGANLRAPITSVGPVLPDIQTQLGLNGIGAGWLNALPLLIFAVLSLVAPQVGRRHGLERVLGAALAAIAAGTLVRSLALPGAIWIGAVLLSVGIAFGNVLLPGLVKRDFPTSASGLIGCYAAAMAATAGLAAGLAVPIAAVPGLDWRWSLGVWALLAFGALIVWLPQWRGRQHHLPAVSDVGPRLSPWRHAIGWQVSLFFACHSLVFYGIVDWFASYAASSGITLAAAGFYLLIYQVVAVATNLAGGPLIRRLRDQTMLGLLCGVLLVIGSGGLLLLPHLSWLWLISAGLGAGIAMVTSLSLFALRTHDHHQAAALSGMAQFIGYVGAAAGPLLIGVLHDLTHAWTAPMLLMVAASLLVTVFATLAGRARFIE
ncbi:MFS transporter [Brevundimonas sp.]|jgi:CP family cyanate transporter-like MFS transporter|uniref:MFS transporter n=1 Tax=Brevundimonas sp. TaxID=1871086 RepID=UPI0037BE4CCD